MPCAPARLTASVLKRLSCQIRRVKKSAGRSWLAAAFASTSQRLSGAAGGAAGVSSNTSYIESASGVGEGARTGLASVITGLLFLVSIFAAPLVDMIPSEAAVPALVLVGFLMMQQIKGIDFDDMEIAIPAFLTIVLMPFTYSITAGIGAGFISYVVIKAVRGKAAEVHALMWLVSALFVLYFAIDPVTRWLTNENRPEVEIFSCAN